MPESAKATVLDAFEKRVNCTFSETFSNSRGVGDGVGDGVGFWLGAGVGSVGSVHVSKQQ